MRTILLFLYGTGVLLSEALTLKESDLDLTRDVITVRRHAHGRTRTIPIGSDVHKLLTTYLRSNVRKNFKNGNLFLTRNGTPVYSQTLNGLFRVVRRNANVVRFDGGRFQPSAPRFQIDIRCSPNRRVVREGYRRTGIIASFRRIPRASWPGFDEQASFSYSRTLPQTLTRQHQLPGSWKPRKQHKPARRGISSAHRSLVFQRQEKHI